MSKELEKIVEQIEKLSIVEALELVKMCEEKWGVSAAAPVAVAAGPAEAVVEKTEFELLLTGAGTSKIEVMKLVRSITSKDLSAAKSFVETASDATPNSIGVFKKEEADKHAEALKAVGAIVKIQ